MKLVLIGFPQETSDEVFKDLAGFIANNTGFIPKIVVMESHDLFVDPRSEEQKIKKNTSKLEEIINNMKEICGDPEDVASFTANFWNAVLIRRIVEIPILEYLAMQPKGRNQMGFLKKHKCECLPELARAALTLMV